MASNDGSKHAISKITRTVNNDRATASSVSTTADTYRVLRGLQAGERYKVRPGDFTSELSMKTKFFVYNKKKCTLSEGVLKVFTKKGNVKKMIDLGISVVSYCIPKRRISINTDVDIFRFAASSHESFQEWIDALYVHRLYRQDKLQFSEAGPSVISRLRTLHKELKMKLLKANVELSQSSTKSHKNRESVKKVIAECLELLQKYEMLFNNTYGAPSISSKSVKESAAAKTTTRRSPVAEDDDEEEDENEADDETSVSTTTTTGAAEPIIPAKHTEKPSSVVTQKQARPFRERLPIPMVPCNLSLWDILKSSIGKDLTKVAFPIEMFEPLGLLQVFCEELEYSQLLDQAAETGDPAMRLALVTAFGVSRYSSTTTRAFRKPFNPIEGETYENIREDLGWSYFAEQVSHHPSISAVHCVGKKWKFFQNVSFDLRFWGRSIYVEPKSSINVIIKNHNESYAWNRVRTSINNLIGGTRYIDHSGKMIVKSSSKFSCDLTFQQSTHGVLGNLIDPNGAIIFKVSGKWSESVNISSSKEKSRRIWTKVPFPTNSAMYYGFTSFAMTLNDLTPELRAVLPPTDTRFRTDQRFLEEGKLDEAKEQKGILEQSQRDRRKAREYKPKWFDIDSTSAEKSKVPNYHFNNHYWESKKNHFQGIVFDELWPNIV